MSAPPSAITLREDLADPTDRDLDLEVGCARCGWNGTLGDLLCDPSLDDDQFWCPRCKASY